MPSAPRPTERTTCSSGAGTTKRGRSTRSVARRPERERRVLLLGLPRDGHHRGRDGARARELNAACRRCTSRLLLLLALRLVLLLVVADGLELVRQLRAV